METPSAGYASAPRAGSRNLPLLVTGLLMLGALFSLANPWFGVWQEAWLWDAEGVGLRTKISAGLWILTGLMAVVFSLAGPIRLRALGLTALSALLLLTSHGGAAAPDSPFAFAANAGTWKWVSSALILGAGLWLARSPTASRSLAVAGGVLVIWVFVCSMEHADDGSASTQLGLIFREWRLLLESPGDLGARWPSAVAETCLITCAIFGCVLGLGVRWRALATSMCVLLALATLTMSLAPAIQRSDAGNGEALLAESLYALMSGGWFLWLVGSLALADLLFSRPGSDDLEFGL